MFALHPFFSLFFLPTILSSFLLSSTSFHLFPSFPFLLYFHRHSPHCYLDCMPQRRTKWLASFLCFLYAVKVMFVPPWQMLALFKSGTEISHDDERQLSVFRIGQTFPSWKTKVEKQLYEMQESKLSDWNAARVYTSTYRWLSWAEGIPDRSCFLFTLILRAFAVLCGEELNCVPQSNSVSVVCLLPLQSVS